MLQLCVFWDETHECCLDEGIEERWNDFWSMYLAKAKELNILVLPISERDPEFEIGRYNKTLVASSKEALIELERFMHSFDEEVTAGFTSFHEQVVRRKIKKLRRYYKNETSAKKEAKEKSF